MSDERRQEDRCEKAERRTPPERRKALADWDGRDWQPESGVNSEDEKRQNQRRQTVLERREENRRKD